MSQIYEHGLPDRHFNDAFVKPHSRHFGKISFLDKLKDIREFGEPKVGFADRTGTKRLSRMMNSRSYEYHGGPVISYFEEYVPGLIPCVSQKMLTPDVVFAL